MISDSAIYVEGKRTESPGLEGTRHTCAERGGFAWVELIEPGEEEFDDDGNPIVQGRVEFEEGEDKPAADPDLAALARESEPDYYKRVFTEYVAARKASGSPDDVSFESFIAKLKVNEGKLKAQYQCRAVRFRVVTKDGKVSLKPVPIV